MNLLFIAIGALILSGMISLILRDRRQAALFTGAAGIIIASAFTAYPALCSLLYKISYSAQFTWNVPLGSLALGIDAISAAFLLPICILSAAAAVYGIGYSQGFIKERAPGSQIFFFNLLVAGMILTVTARNGILFLISWEIMALSSFFLVACEHEREEVRNAGWMYFTASHLGTGFLFVMFAMFAGVAGSFDFDSLASSDGYTPFIAGILFIFGLIGFGTKAGIMPFHVWLPVAHPVAMSHVSALMSGVMIKTGIYGIVRIISFFPLPQPWWGWLLIGLGALSAVFAVLHAHGQKDLKSLLAYSSIENMGIVFIGLGVGLMGKTMHSPLVTAFGFGGAFLHVINHALFKGILFLSAGSILTGTQSRRMDLMGGLMKRMPWTGGLFLAGSAAAAALPPLNGFIGEFLIYSGAFTGMITSEHAGALPYLAAIAALALAGGLAAACFIKAFGIIFLGEPRSEAARASGESSAYMIAPAVILASLCLAIGIFPAACFRLLLPAIGMLSGEAAGNPPVDADFIVSLLNYVSYGVAILLATTAIIAILRLLLLSKRRSMKTVTWDCGYAMPSPKMQYTAWSFSQPLADLFGAGTGVHKIRPASLPLFPGKMKFASGVSDVLLEYFYTPLFRAFSQFSYMLRPLQHGRIHLYILYIVIVLLALLLWRLQ